MSFHSAVRFAFTLVLLTGCATTNGSVRDLSRADVVGTAVHSEVVTTTTTTGPNGVVSTTTTKTITTNAPAVDMKLKEAGMSTIGATSIAKSAAKAASATARSSCMSIYSCGGGWGSGVVSIGGIGGGVRNGSGDIVFPGSIRSNAPDGVNVYRRP